MPSKEQLIDKLINKQRSTSFTKHDLDSLMSKCDCVKESGGRGSAIKFINLKYHVIMIFDAPHPQKELFNYQRKKVIDFLKKIGEIK